MNTDGLEPRRCEDIKGIVAPEIGPKSFGTFKIQAPGFKRCWGPTLNRDTGFELRAIYHDVLSRGLQYKSRDKTLNSIT